MNTAFHNASEIKFKLNFGQLEVIKGPIPQADRSAAWPQAVVICSSKRWSSPRLKESLHSEKERNKTNTPSQTNRNHPPKSNSRH